MLIANAPEKTGSHTRRHTHTYTCCAAERKIPKPNSKRHARTISLGCGRSRCEAPRSGGRLALHKPDEAVAVDFATCPASERQQTAGHSHTATQTLTRTHFSHTWEIRNPVISRNQIGVHWFGGGGGLPVVTMVLGWLGGGRAVCEFTCNRV